MIFYFSEITFFCVVSTHTIVSQKTKPVLSPCTYFYVAKTCAIFIFTVKNIHDHLYIEYIKSGLVIKT